MKKKKSDLKRKSESDVSSKKAGSELVDEVVKGTGLPDELVHHELAQILQHSGQEKESLTLEQLRVAMMNYLETLNEQMESQERSRRVAKARDSEKSAALASARLVVRH